MNELKKDNDGEQNRCHHAYARLQFPFLQWI